MDDLYEVLQISPNADPDAIHRVYRLLAQRCHPDNAESGSDERFRRLCDAYQVLSDPVERARYDVHYQNRQHQRWRLVSANAKVESRGYDDHAARLTVLEVLYARRRLEPSQPGALMIDLEDLTGCPREHLEFTLWYLAQKGFLQRGDDTRLMITVAGVDYLEANDDVRRRRLLRDRNDPHPAAVPVGVAS
jgi:curved DNA-binding protein CbpA